METPQTAVTPSLFTAKEVASRFRISESSVKRLAREDASFPKPVRIGARSARWRQSDLESYVNSGVNREQ